MSTVRQMLAGLLDSPTYGRDRANLITGFSIGTAALLLNGAVLMFVLPVMAAPFGSGMNNLADKLEFGQLLALILLGGATALATLLIPLRLVTVFWEPRVGRYFDQIVLSGISPLRFVIGKATSQNLFVGLILFLLMPYFVLSLTLGGVHLGIFAAGLFLVWLYCLALALLTLWVSLYLNELLAALFVMATASILLFCGCFPMRYQPFVVTPFPALMHPVYRSMPGTSDILQQDFLTVFGSCAVGISALICASLIAIYFGPLYGIIRENSTFGEVVRPGDSKRKRWLRVRLHIQRPSEIAFFYQNRSHWFLRYEGLFRWGCGFCGLLLLSLGSVCGLVYYEFKQVAASGQSIQPWRIMEFHAMNLTIHGLGLGLAVILFSHGKSTTYARIPFVRGWTVEVSKLDTIAFLLFAMISAAISIATPIQFERYVAIPNGTSMFPPDFDPLGHQGRAIDFVRVVNQGTLTISVVFLTVYAFQRLVCLGAWMRSVSAIVVGVLYSVFICMLPVYAAMISLEVNELRRFQLLEKWAPTLAAVSPFTAMTIVYNGKLGQPFPEDLSPFPFYIVHFVLLCLALLGIRRNGRRLRRMYLKKNASEVTP